MHIGIMEPTKRSLDGFSGQKIDEAQAVAEVAGRQSNYMTNMVLPEIVQSSKNFPLGPDCVITRDEAPEQSILLEMDLYWLVSHEKGCVECKVMVSKSAGGKQAVTQDPRVIITRKPRRFEAYCCAVCRRNFVTVVQALLHMKAFHRKGKKILIQDQNVFHDIEKAMEVPPVPLPWYVSKRTAEQLPSTTVPFSVASSSIQTTVTTIPDVDNVSSAGQDINPVALLLKAVVKEYNKSVKMVLFGEDVKTVTIKFEDQTSLAAHLPDIKNQECHKFDSTETLEFKIQRFKSESQDQESCMVYANNPQLASELLQTAIKRGVSQSSVSAMADQIGDSINKVNHPEQHEKNDRSRDSQSSQIKLDSRGRPSKTVRFMIGSPDSDEDGSSSASDRVVGRESCSPLVIQGESPAPSDDATTTTTGATMTKTTPSTDNNNNTKDDEGLKGVISQLISTASKGVISPVSPTPSAVVTAGIQEAVITNAAYHARFMPKNLSVPNFPSVSIAGSNSMKSSVSTSYTAPSAGLIRVQSWGGSNPSNKMSLGNYTPHVPLNVARDDLRRSFAAGRSFTYAEKIKLMNKLNDEDKLITQEHVKGAGKLMGVESSRGHIPQVASLPSIQQSTVLEMPLSPTVISSTMKMKKSESDLGTKLFPASDVRRKRRSKYDLDQFGNLGSSHLFHASSNVRSSSEGSSVSDKEELDDTPPTLLGLLRNRAGLLVGTTVTGNTATVISDSDYYGSGEWANAAMQTLKKLQSTVNASKVTDHSSTKLVESRQWPSTEEVSVSSEMKPHSATQCSSLTTSSFVPVAGPGSSGSAIDTMVALAQQITSEKARLQPHVTDALHSKMKRPYSPLSDDEKDVCDASPIDERHAKRKKIYISMTNPSSSSDSTLSKPIKTNLVQQRPHVIAENGDCLVFTERVTDTSLHDSNKMILKFSQSTSLDTSNNTENEIEMPSLFVNSIDTYMKVRYIEKIAKCRVCGFSTPVDTVSNMETLKSHVVEHSLKELMQAGCGAKQPL